MSILRRACALIASSTARSLACSATAGSTLVTPACLDAACPTLDRVRRTYSLTCTHSQRMHSSSTQPCCSTSMSFAWPGFAAMPAMRMYSAVPPVKLNSLTPGRRKYRKRRARGGGDKHAGRGMNGQKSRRGTGSPALFFEGGQTPLWKRLPKRGFHNRFKYVYDTVYLSDLDAAIRDGKLDPSRVITMKHVYDAGLIDKKAYNRNGVALIGRVLDGFEIPIDIEVARVSASAKEEVEAAGGQVTRVYYNKLGMRALLLPEWFPKKGRLLPRAVQMVPYKKQWRYDRVGTLPPPDAPAFGDCPPLMEAPAA